MGSGHITMRQVMDNPRWRAAYLAQTKPATPAVAEPPRPVEPPMNGLERAYALELDRLKAAGTVTWWAFNKVRLRIADGAKAAWYKPDFFVEFADGHFEMHETKGHERQRGLLALKVAAGQFPMFRFVLVKRVKGEWVCEEFKSG